jgi:hypothetical protein
MLALPSRKTLRMCSPMCRSNQPRPQITWRTSAAHQSTEDTGAPLVAEM